MKRPFATDYVNSTERSPTHPLHRRVIRYQVVSGTSTRVFTPMFVTIQVPLRGLSRKTKYLLLQNYWWIKDHLLKTNSDYIKIYIMNLEGFHTKKAPLLFPSLKRPVYSDSTPQLLLRNKILKSTGDVTMTRTLQVFCLSYTSNMGRTDLYLATKGEDP